MSTRAAMAAGLSALGGRPEATGAALLAGAAAGLGERAAAAAAASVGSPGDPGTWGRAALLWLIGSALAALIAAAGMAGALAAASGEPRGGVLRVSLGRGVAMLSLRAVEEVLLGALLLAALAPALRVFALGRGPLVSAAAMALGVAAPLAVGLIALPAFRVAQVRTAAGRPSPLALADGIALAFARLPALLVYGAFAALATAPLWVAALALARLSGGAPAAQIAVAGTRGALMMAAFLCSYAGLAEIIAERR